MENMVRDEDKYYNGLVEFILNKWSKDIKNNNNFDSALAKDNIEAMIFLLSNYRLKCLIKTIMELDDYLDDYEVIYRNTVCDNI